MNKYGFILLMLCSQLLGAQTIFGKWKTVDEATGEEKSVVEIYEENGKVYGKIVDIFDASKRDLPCKFCEGDAYNKPLIGLVIIKDLERVGAVYKRGTITNPEDGKVYDCRITLDDDDKDILQLRGYIAFFYRTQYWKRVN